MKRIFFTVLAVTILWMGCDEDTPNPTSCEDIEALESLGTRDFKMGFSSWNFGPDQSDIDETYQFINSNADIYSEQIDHKIPWDAWINNTPLPTEFLGEIESKVAQRLEDHQLLLSVSLLNTDRSDLLEDYDGTIPAYTFLNDQHIEDAYFQHLQYLITQFNPNYLVIAMEVNDLKLKSAAKWNAYQLLMSNIRARLKYNYPDLLISESVTLHNWYEPEVPNPFAYITELADYINQNMDFAAISFYPFFKNQHTKAEFQETFNFLHSVIGIPIAFVETTHLAENLEISSLDLNITSDVCEQQAYLETLILNAYSHDYQFIIWWAYRDYDELWATFPPDVQDIGKVWRDTGLLDEDGEERPSYDVWELVFNK